MKEFENNHMNKELRDEDNYTKNFKLDESNVGKSIVMQSTVPQGSKAIEDQKVHQNSAYKLKTVNEMWKYRILALKTLFISVIIQVSICAILVFSLMQIFQMDLESKNSIIIWIPFLAANIYIIRGLILLLVYIYHSIKSPTTKYVYRNVYPDNWVRNGINEIELGEIYFVDFCKSILNRMRKINTKKTKIVIAVCFSILIILNPTTSQFRDYIGERDVTKKMNFLVVSVYEYNGNKYLGLLMNFIPL